MAARSFNPTTKEVDPEVQGYPWLYWEFRANLGYITHYFKKPKTKVRILAVGRVLACCVQSPELNPRH